MLGRLSLSKTAIVEGLDKTAGAGLLQGVYKFLAKKLHPDKRTSTERKIAEKEFADLNNVYEGLRKLIAGHVPDRAYFIALDIPEPKVTRLRPDTSYTSRSPQTARTSASPGAKELRADIGNYWRQAAEASLKRYRRARYLGFGAAALATVGAAGIGLLPVTTFYELAASMISHRDLNWGLLKAVENAYPTSATVGCIGAYGGLAADLFRGQYSTARRALRNTFRPIPR